MCGDVHTAANTETGRITENSDTENIQTVKRNVRFYDDENRREHLVQFS